ncbi:MAG: hypothetical protein F6K58_25620 [Symploca sp. SIO2E9]|nr:hypothetical protein [Symploca sp. SIO2E9]
MSTRRLVKSFRKLFKIIWKLSRAITKAFMKWLLRSLLVLGRRRSFARAGFVLPTVTMVTLVVVLLTTAILIRSFDRAKNASNFRVNRAVLAAATPAIDRARAKLKFLFEDDPTLPRATPSDEALENALINDRYNFGDETRLLLEYDFDTDNEDDKKLDSAWRFPVDTDNNGKFDSYTLYGIYYKNPPVDETNDGKKTFARARTPLEARTLPIDEGQLSLSCQTAAGGGALVSTNDWFRIGSRVKKAFFVYTTNVPITDTDGLDDKYELYTGNKGFSALEMHQDRARIPLNNNAVWFDDDIEVGNLGGPFNLNGRVFTNGNLLVGSASYQGGADNQLKFYQVSSPESCYYEEENSEILVGGNVALGDIRIDEDATEPKPVEVHLFKGRGIENDPTKNGNDGIRKIDGKNNTTTEDGGSKVGYNSLAFDFRIGAMISKVLENNGVNFEANAPQTVIDAVDKAIKEGQDQTKSIEEIQQQELRKYFRERVRRVPFTEVATANRDDALGAFINDPLPNGEPPLPWRILNTNNTGLTLNSDGDTLFLPTTDPLILRQEQEKKEFNIGDRISLGNGLPKFWTEEGEVNPGKYKQGEQTLDQEPNDFRWNNKNGNGNTDNNRTRESQIQTLDDLGDTGRGGFWEAVAAKAEPYETDDFPGGLRIVTGAGVYGYPGSTIDALNTDVGFNPSFLPNLTTLDNFEPPPNAPTELGGNPYHLVWPDTMPMQGGVDNPITINIDENTAPPDFRMRATVLYHYAANEGAEQTPIACVSSYYDPTNYNTAHNGTVGLPWDRIGAAIQYNPWTTPPDIATARSNNGVVYNFTTSTATNLAAHQAELIEQATMMFPDGRLANMPLHEAMRNDANGDPLTLADRAAIDAASCAIEILEDTVTPGGPAYLANGAIKEAAFLDAREIKAISSFLDDPEALNPLGTEDEAKIALNQAQGLNSIYTLPLEQRQPLEIRVTEIDLAQLRLQQVGDDFLLPNSGIIYATRDDALPDLSQASGETLVNQDAIDAGAGDDINSDRNYPSPEQEEVSPSDFQLDPTRRPNGIRLINGQTLSRTNNNDFDEENEEKGLILASNVPVYIQGNFNLHAKPGPGEEIEEFTQPLQGNYRNFYTRDKPNNSFACRNGQPGCDGTGDQWRPATILADAVTLLSDDFVDGFRNQGDYDLGNHVGNSAVDTRLNNGFWWNNFVTSALWWDRGDTPTPFPRNKPNDNDGVLENSYVGSYLVNGVTPIQRRTEFPEYQMEICRRIPASLCGPNDWKQSGAGTTGNINTDNSDGLRYVAPEDLGYPRRVAFERNAYGLLTLVGNGNLTPQPRGIVGNTPQPFQYGNASTTPDLADNALWFAVTDTGNTDPATLLADPNTPDYNDNALPYYLVDNEDPAQLSTDPNQQILERQILLPGTPEFPEELVAILPNLEELNGEAADDPSDFAVCIGTQGSQQEYNVTNALPNPCPGVNNEIGLVIADLAQLRALATDPRLENVVADLTQVTPLNPLELNAQAKVNVYELAPGETIAGNITLNNNQHIDPIFVIKSAPGESIVFDASSNIPDAPTNLQGVNPNNIFWVSDLDMTINSTQSLTGNFLGSGNLAINAGNIFGGRFLGFATGTLGGNITAMTAAQPQLIPMLQIFNPTGEPANGAVAFDGQLEEQWLQRVEEDEQIYNAAFVAGNSPSRPSGFAEGVEETGGGLNNFVRFLEAWEKNSTTKIEGSFIQAKRSAYATGPYQAADWNQDTLFFNGDPETNPVYSQGTRFDQFNYRGGAEEFRVPFFRAPARQYGYDVAILSQSPDLFSERFTQPPAGNPQEFFREVGRDDPWVETLLCAQEKENPNQFAIPEDQRPQDCI